MEAGAARASTPARRSSRWRSASSPRAATTARTSSSSPRRWACRRPPSTTTSRARPRSTRRCSCGCSRPSTPRVREAVERAEAAPEDHLERLLDGAERPPRRAPHYSKILIRVFVDPSPLDADRVVPLVERVIGRVLRFYREGVDAGVFVRAVVAPRVPEPARRDRLPLRERRASARPCSASTISSRAATVAWRREEARAAPPARRRCRSDRARRASPRRPTARGAATRRGSCSARASGDGPDALASFAAPRDLGRSRSSTSGPTRASAAKASSASFASAGGACVEPAPQPVDARRRSRARGRPACPRA